MNASTLTHDKNGYWMVGMNYVPKGVSHESTAQIEKTLLYIYRKLCKAGLEDAMLPEGVDNNKVDIDGKFLIRNLCCSDAAHLEKILRESYPESFSHLVINLFDCIPDRAYTDGVMKLPQVLKNAKQ